MTKCNKMKFIGPVSPFGLMAPGIFAVMAPLWGSEMEGSNGFKNA